MTGVNFSKKECQPSVHSLRRSTTTTSHTDGYQSGGELPEVHPTGRKTLCLSDIKAIVDTACEESVFARTPSSSATSPQPPMSVHDESDYNPYYEQAIDNQQHNEYNIGDETYKYIEGNT